MKCSAPLLEVTKQLLVNRGDVSLREIAEGAGVGFDWLSKFSQGAIPDPSVNRIQSLHDYLVSLKHERAA